MKVFPGDLKLTWVYYTARIGLAAWVTTLVMLLVSSVGELPRLDPNIPFTWGDIGNAAITFAITIHLAFLAGRERYKLEEFRRIRARTAALRELNAELQEYINQNQQSEAQTPNGNSES